MSNDLPTIYLARHGETAWTLSHQHTGRTDIPLTPRGEANARSLGERLRGIEFQRVLTSPLERARRTCKLAGFDSATLPEPDLMEWDYGDYDGLTTVEISARILTGRSFATAAPAANRSSRSEPAPIGSSPASEPPAAASSSSATAIFSASSPPAGSASLQPADGCST